MGSLLAQGQCLCISGAQREQECVHDGPARLAHEQHLQPELCGGHADLLAGLHRRPGPQLREPVRPPAGRSRVRPEAQPDGPHRGPHRVHLAAAAAGGGRHELPPVLPEPAVPSGRPELARPGAVAPAAPAAGAGDGERAPRLPARLWQQRLLTQRGPVGAALAEQPGAAQHRALAQLQRRLHPAEPEQRLRLAPAVAAGAGRTLLKEENPDGKISKMMGGLESTVMCVTVDLVVLVNLSMKPG